MIIFPYLNLNLKINLKISVNLKISKNIRKIWKIYHYVHQDFD